MATTRLKQIIWALLLALAVAVGSATVGGAAELIASFQRGADPASALNIVPNVPPDLHVTLSWRPGTSETGTDLDPFTRREVESAYLRAWLQWNLSYLKGEPYGLSTYFTGPALAAVGEGVRTAAADGLRIEQADLAHQLRLHVLSADGAVIAFTDEQALVARVIRDAAGTVVFAGETRADYDVVMLLEDGQWHVRHWVRRAAEAGATAPARHPCAGCVTLGQGQGSRELWRDGRPLRVAGINYYPQATPWDRFWPQYNPAVIDRDWSRIKGLGLNTVRIFVPFAQFGGARIDPVMRERLRDLLDRASAQQLLVIVTLFDFRADYDLLHWPDADRHLETLLSTFSDHPAILAWDLKNEPDLDDRRVGAAVVDAWLAHTAALARRYDPHHLITIGWSSAGTAQRLANLVDIVQFHDYAPAEGLAGRYAALRAALPGQPLLLGEFGLPTWNSVFPNGHTEAEQAAYYALVLDTLRTTDAVGGLAWMLYDVASAPAGVAGPWPWQTGPQRAMGVLRADGNAKPAAPLLAPDAPLKVSPVPAWARFLKPFWLLVFCLPLATTILLWRRAIKHRLSPRRRAVKSRPRNRRRHCCVARRYRK